MGLTICMVIISYGGSYLNDSHFERAKFARIQGLLTRGKSKLLTWWRCLKNKLKRREGFEPFFVELKYKSLCLIKGYLIVIFLKIRIETANRANLLR